MTTAAIDAHLLLKVLYTSLLAGVGVSVVFAIAVLGLVRSSDARREERPTAAASYALLGAVGLILSAGLIVFGLILLAHKS
jgi:predicted membrane channel-forming protein YqfA (hemolysin III family)